MFLAETDSLLPFVVSCNTEADSYCRKSKESRIDLAKSLLLLTSFVVGDTRKTRNSDC